MDEELYCNEARLEMETEQQFNERMKPVSDKLVEDKTITRRQFLCIGVGGLLGLGGGARIGKKMHTRVSAGLAKDGITVPKGLKTAMIATGSGVGGGIGASVGAAIGSFWNAVTRERNKAILETCAYEDQKRESKNELKQIEAMINTLPDNVERY